MEHHVNTTTLCNDFRDAMQSLALNDEEIRISTRPVSE